MEHMEIVTGVLVGFVGGIFTILWFITRAMKNDSDW